MLNERTFTITVDVREDECKPQDSLIGAAEVAQAIAGQFDSKHVSAVTVTDNQSDSPALSGGMVVMLIPEMRSY